MKVILLVACILPVFSIAQIPGKKLKDPFAAENGVTFKEGDVLMIGTGSDDNGEFAYIFQPDNYLAGVEKQNLEPMYSNIEVKIKHFKEFKIRKLGTKIVAVINPFGGFNYVVDINGAIQYGEVIGVNGKLFEKPSPETQAASGSGKVGKLKDLKDLLDAGAISEDEYKKLKEEIINK